MGTGGLRLIRRGSSSLPEAGWLASRAVKNPGSPDQRPGVGARGRARRARPSAVVSSTVSPLRMTSSRSHRCATTARSWLTST